VGEESREGPSPWNLVVDFHAIAIDCRHHASCQGFKSPSRSPSAIRSRLVNGRASKQSVSASGSSRQSYSALRILPHRFFATAQGVFGADDARGCKGLASGFAKGPASASLKF